MISYKPGALRNEGMRMSLLIRMHLFCGGFGDSRQVSGFAASLPGKPDTL